MRLALVVLVAASLAFASQASLGAPQSSNNDLVKRSNILHTASDVQGQSFDYIIAGGGLTGLTAASGLSLANPQARILVVEAGDDTRNDDQVKSFNQYGSANGNRRYDWRFPTTVQEVGGRSLRMVQGRGLGGSSSINGGAFTFPPISQLDAFLQFGNASFDGQTFFTNAKQTQNYVAPSDYIKSLGVTAKLSAHGTGGPVTIGFSDKMFTGPQERAFLQAQQQALGTPTVQDLGDGDENNAGAAFIPQTTLPNSGAARTRVSSATAFVSADGKLSQQVSILLNTRVAKILFSQDRHPTTGRAIATGVALQSSRDGPTVQVNAKQVIVAAGAIRSPVLLQHSGIGDGNLLNKIGVKQIVDLSGVGKNLIDQQLTEVHASQPNQSPGGDSSPNSAIAMNSVGQLMSNASDVRAYIESNMNAWAQQAFDAGASASVEGLVSQYKALVSGIFDSNWPISETFFVAKSDEYVQQVWALLSFSRGYVQASSSSTWDRSTVNPRYWTAPIDMDFQVAASRGARRVFQTSAMRALLTQGESQPGFDANNGGIPQSANSKTFGLYRRWRKYVLDTYKPVNHPMGTCAMAPKASGGVVGGNFKVHGTTNVYVIDASVVPMQQSTHLSSMLYGLAQSFVNQHLST